MTISPSRKAEMIRQRQMEKIAFMRLPPEERLARAVKAQNWRARTPHALRLKVKVIKVQGKPLLLMLGERTFVSSFTWDTLLHKAVNTPWLSITPTLRKRLGMNNG